jgi:hypothetical protein
MASLWLYSVSTETALIKVQNDILQFLDQNSVTVLVLLDLSAAFDTIDHATLLHRLEHDFGVEGTPLKWMTSYLSDRYQTVCIDGQLSEAVHMTYSVPQGSVLGPKNYVMYTKPVGSICRSHGIFHHFYADDSQLYLAFKPKDNAGATEALSRIESCLSDIVSWMHTNMLKLNTDKTEVIVFSSKLNERFVADTTITIGTSKIKPSNVVKNLGAFFDSRMNMDDHVNSVCRSSYAQLRKIGYIRKYLTRDATKSLVNGLVTSRLDYCNALLYGLPKTTLNRLQTVQNTAARIISKTSRFCHITPIIKELHWLPIDCRIKYKILTLTYKALHDQAPPYINSMLELYRPGRALRSQDDALTLVHPRRKTMSYGDRCFSACAPHLWNPIPMSLRQSGSFVAFKKGLKTYLFRQHYEALV